MVAVETQNRFDQNWLGPGCDWSILCVARSSKRATPTDKTENEKPDKKLDKKLDENADQKPDKKAAQGTYRGPTHHKLDMPCHLGTSLQTIQHLDVSI